MLHSAVLDSVNAILDSVLLYVVVLTPVQVSLRVTRWARRVVYPARVVRGRKIQ